MVKITKKYVSEKMKEIKRRPDANKYSSGSIMICAGSYGMAGAAIMCGKGALYSGAGLITYNVVEEIIPVLQVAVPEAMCTSIEKDMLLSKYDAIAIGPGLLTEIGERRLRRFIKGYNNKLIVDAESLNILAKTKSLDLIKERTESTVLTPHEGEMARLIGFDSTAVKEDRVGAARKLHELTGADVVLKGHETIVITRDGDEFINSTGNPGMATGGSGDVLTGLITSLAAQGLSSSDAAVCGVYIHGRAGDICAKEYGVLGMSALDIADKLREALADVLK